jgi:transglutaminase-like putative cysteine protease
MNQRPNCLISIIREYFSRLSIPFILASLGLGLLFWGAGDVKPAVLAAPAADLYAPGEMDNNLTGVCVYVVTGTLSSKYTLHNPGGVISGLSNYTNATYNQKVTALGPSTAELEITSKAFLTTDSVHPFKKASLPLGYDIYLKPESGIDPIHQGTVALASSLTSAATRQAEAVNNIITWVGANILFDPDVEDNRSESVYNRRTATAEGFSNLSVALLRAASIPARIQRGCGLSTDKGRPHTWIEVYYLDAGWVASEPQSKQNYILPEYITDETGGFSACADIEVTRTLSPSPVAELYDLQTSIQSSHEWIGRSANVTTWNRFPFYVTPQAVTVMVQPVDPVKTLDFIVSNKTCFDSTGQSKGWRMETEAEWLTPISGSIDGPVSLPLDASGLPLGVYTTTVTVYAAQDLSNTQVQQVVPVTLVVAEEIHAVYLPMARRK